MTVLVREDLNAADLAWAASRSAPASEKNAPCGFPQGAIGAHPERQRSTAVTVAPSAASGDVP